MYPLMHLPNGKHTRYIYRYSSAHLKSSTFNFSGTYDMSSHRPNAQNSVSLQKLNKCLDCFWQTLFKVVRKIFWRFVCEILEINIVKIFTYNLLNPKIG